MNELPDDLLLIIISNLDIKLDCIFVCKKWIELLNDNVDIYDLDKSIKLKDYYSINYTLSIFPDFLSDKIIIDDDMISKIVIFQFSIYNVSTDYYLINKLLKFLTDNEKYNIIGFFLRYDNFLTSLTKNKDIFESILKRMENVFVIETLIDLLDKLIGIENFNLVNVLILKYSNEIKFRAIPNKSSFLLKLLKQFDKNFINKQSLLCLMNGLKFNETGCIEAYFECIRNGYYGIIDKFDSFKHLYEIMTLNVSYHPLLFILNLSGEAKRNNVFEYFDHTDKNFNLVLEQLNLRDKYNEYMK